MFIELTPHLRTHELDRSERFSDDGVEKVSLEVGDTEADVERRILK